MQREVRGWITFCLALALAPWSAVAAGPPPDSAEAVALVEEFHDGLRDNQPGRVSAILGPSFTIFNGNFSGDPRNWETHLYLTGARLAQWPANFLRVAGPYENQVKIIRVYLRGDAGLVVTEETGRNRVRQWRNELVAYLLGRDSGRWQMVGYFIKDIANPK
jgi:hypothetical protein